MSGSPPLIIRLGEEPIELAKLENLLEDPDTGAQAWFLGVTRRKTEVDGVTRVTERLFYEANESMARKQLGRLAEDARIQFELSKVVIVHRLGDVAIGEASVAVGCSSKHRVAAFQALPWIMDQLKSDVAIWKRELYADGTKEWVHPTQ